MSHKNAWDEDAATDRIGGIIELEEAEEEKGESIEPKISEDVKENKTKDNELERAKEEDAEIKRRPTIASADDAKEEIKIRRKARTERFYLFGPSEESSDAAGTYQEQVRIILAESQETILKHIDEYYRKKGTRPITRPSLPDYFEQCATNLSTKLISFQTQTNEYWKNSIVDFGRQLHRIESLVVKIPRLILRTAVMEQLQVLHNRHQQLYISVEDDINKLQYYRKQHQNMLHPDIGHPKFASQLAKVDREEKRRHDEFSASISAIYGKVEQIKKETATEASRQFSQVIKSLYDLSDQLMVVDDLRFFGVELGHDLLEFHDEPLAEKLRSRKARKWPILSDIMSEDTDTCLTVMSNKTTLVHLATEAGSKAWQLAFKQEVWRAEEKMKDWLESHHMEEDEWLAYWRDSTKKIKGIYRTLEDD